LHRITVLRQAGFGTDVGDDLAGGGLDYQKETDGTGAADLFHRIFHVDGIFGLFGD
jgi:hypothetical protein